MFESFMIKALIGAVLTSIFAAPVGLLMIWRKETYFSDTLSHCVLLGVVAGILMGINLNISIFILVGVIAILLIKLPDHKMMDIYLMILGQTALCVGFVCLSFMPNFRADLTQYLFGDVLMTTTTDLIYTATVGMVCGILFIKNWDKQVFCAVHPELARCEGIDVRCQNILFTVILAFFVAVCFKTTGMLLISALLIIPAATASSLSKTPEQALIISIFLGVLCSFAGIGSSYYFDVPTAPAIEICCAGCFLISKCFVRK